MPPTQIGLCPLIHLPLVISFLKTGLTIPFIPLGQFVALKSYKKDSNSIPRCTALQDLPPIWFPAPSSAISSLHPICPKPFAIPRTFLEFFLVSFALHLCFALTLSSTLSSFPSVRKGIQIVSWQIF